MEHGLREDKLTPHPYSAIPMEEIKEKYTYNFNFTSEDLWKGTGIVGPFSVIEPPKPKDYGVTAPNSLIIDFDSSNIFTIENSWFFYKNIKINAKECIDNYINKKRKRERMEAVAEDIIKNKKIKQ